MKRSRLIQTRKSEIIVHRRKKFENVGVDLLPGHVHRLVRPAIEDVSGDHPRLKENSGEVRALSGAGRGQTDLGRPCVHSTVGHLPLDRGLQTEEVTYEKLYIFYPSS